MYMYINGRKSRYSETTWTCYWKC